MTDEEMTVEELLEKWLQLGDNASDRRVQDCGYRVLRKEMPINPWLYEEVRREDGSLLTARICNMGDVSECFICEDEAMLPQMMRDFWTSVGRRNIKCE